MRWKRRLGGGSTVIWYIWEYSNNVWVSQYFTLIFHIRTPWNFTVASKEIKTASRSRCITLFSLTVTGFWLLELSRCPACLVNTGHVLVWEAVTLTGGQSSPYPVICPAAPRACAHSLQKVFLFSLLSRVWITGQSSYYFTTEILVNVINCYAILIDSQNFAFQTFILSL